MMAEATPPPYGRGGPRVTVMCGGVGAARFLTGLMQVIDPANITAIVNTGDDVTLYGLHISPDIDTCIYTTSKAINQETGWGLQGETWRAMEGLQRYSVPAWFNLGDSDLATHMYRTQRLHEGASLSEVTSEIAAAWGLAMTMLPVTNDPVETRVTTLDEGEIGFQEYFVRRQHAVAITDVRFAGADAASAAPGVLDSIAAADIIVVAPSNPIVSIAPLLAIPGVQTALEQRRESTVAISPIIAGAALKGPADRMMAELGHDPSVVGVARLYSSFAHTLLVDDADIDNSSAVADAGMRCVVCPTVMSGSDEAATLAQRALDAARSPRGSGSGATEGTTS